MRLDAVTKRAEKDPKTITANEIHRFEKDVTRPMKWSLLLARLWLENINVEIQGVSSPTEKPVAGWLATLTRASSYNTEEDATPVEFHGRHQSRQYNGLLHFARKLDWPHIDGIINIVAQGTLCSSKSTSSTPAIGTPLSITTQRSSYFSGSTRPGNRRGLSRTKIPTTIHPSGWLSKSYLTGLVLPGEGLNHFLISTLLENDEVAIDQLGKQANLYGGFVYAKKSFWSTACIIGRVLAAGKGSSECMGWLSSSILPHGVDEGWINIDVELEPRSGM
jgi:hypothetical protein